MEPEIAAGLSFLFPGLGQIYNHDYGRGILWFVIGLFLWIATGGLVGWIANVISSYTAFRRAERTSLNVMATETH
jgi:TM2 domain-containing membrane protein YozV